LLPLLLLWFRLLRCSGCWLLWLSNGNWLLWLLSGLLLLLHGLLLLLLWLQVHSR
jgi:hypothetical protein